MPYDPVHADDVTAHDSPDALLRHTGDPQLNNQEVLQNLSPVRSTVSPLRGHYRIPPQKELCNTDVKEWSAMRIRGRAFLRRGKAEMRQEPRSRDRAPSVSLVFPDQRGPAACEVVAGLGHRAGVVVTVDDRDRPVCSDGHLRVPIELPKPPHHPQRALQRANEGRFIPGPTRQYHNAGVPMWRKSPVVEKALIVGQENPVVPSSEGKNLFV